MEDKHDKVIFSRISWDAEYYASKMMGNGFDISDSEAYFDDDKGETKKRRKSMYGTQSPLYGNTFDSERDYMQSHQCDCGRFYGATFTGQICPECNTEVSQKYPNLNKIGWISTHGNKIITPYWYYHIAGLIGKDNMIDLCRLEKKVDKNGNIKVITPENYVPRHQYHGIGPSGFYDKFEEILWFFANQRKQKFDAILGLIKYKNMIFASHIPLYHPVMRPSSETADVLYYNPIDRDVNPMVKIAISLENKDMNELARNMALNSIHTKLLRLWDTNFSIIEKKEGTMKTTIVGGNINYISRNVIVPDASLRCNEVDVSYITMLVFADFQIMKMIMDIQSVPLSKAYSRWSMAFVKFDNFIYDIMNMIIKDDPYILLNRNPTLHFYSMNLCHIRKIKTDMYDTTLSVNLSILPGLNADFDGDQLNITYLFDKNIKKMFLNFDPLNSMIVDKSTGKLNPYFAVQKQQLLAINGFLKY